MADENKKPDEAETPEEPTGITEHKVKIDLPELLGKVPYEYSNLARLASSRTDIRIAFGDVTPMGELVPKFGVVLSPSVAKSLLQALERMVAKVEEALGSEIPAHKGIEVDVDSGKIAPEKNAEK